MPLFSALLENYVVKRNNFVFSAFMRRNDNTEILSEISKSEVLPHNQSSQCVPIYNLSQLPTFSGSYEAKCLDEFHKETTCEFNGTCTISR
jgi:hypothetical protein